jgi:hypothetical protein
MAILISNDSDQRELLKGCAERIDGTQSKNELLSAINDTLLVPSPAGNPTLIEHSGERYRQLASLADEIGEEAKSVGKSGLPKVWAGVTGATAAESVMAASRNAQGMSEVFHQGGGTLIALADSLFSAQQKDSDGRDMLREALRGLGGEDGFFDDMVETDEESDARWKFGQMASTGAWKMHAAADIAVEAGRQAAEDFNKYASEARAGRMDTDELSDADKLALADTAVPGGPRDENELLTSSDLERSSRNLDKMNAHDRVAFEKLLSESKSPQERAYLVKALAAGHSLESIEDFQSKIHGKSPTWLREHLTPVTTAADSMDDEGQAANTSNNNTDTVAFKGQRWEQGGDGSEGTCVASSTVTARAMVDPVYALELTGGTTGQDDDPEAFRQRLIEEQHRVHTEGDGGDNWGGMGQEGQEKVNDSEIGSYTGDDYEPRSVNNNEDRRDVLPDIEKAVAEGRPVPVDISGKEGAHAVRIIGQEGDMLQVYNPWGTTTWVSEDDFVNGHMNKAADERLNEVYSVYVPQ